MKDLKRDTVCDQITKLTNQAPNKIAIRQGDRQLSYKMLEISSNQVANTLATNISEQKNVVTLLENSIELVQAMIGIMKAGCVFVPIDPSYPEGRVKMMMKKVEAFWVVTTSRHLDKLQSLLASESQQLHVILMDEEAPTTVAGKIKPYSPWAAKQEANSWAMNSYSYIYFTSGSTGKPKAILGKHRSLKHFIDWEIKEFQIDQNCVGSQLTSASFDPFLRDVFVPLCAGGTLCIPEDRGILLLPQRLKEWLNNGNITLVHIVPTLFRALMEEVENAACFPSLQYVLLAGELLRGRDVKKFLDLFQNRIQLINLYGPTETTLAKVFYRIQPGDEELLTIPIGKPIDSTQLLILGANRKPSQIGNAGEIYIRTPYITAGYYQDKALNAEVFISNPFSTNKQDVLYKTGDRGRQLPSGDFVIIDRIDFQVKIRGFRVEVGEIENRLLEFAEVKEAVVTARDTEFGDKSLCAYIVTKAEIATDHLRQHLFDHLPDYMVPSSFMRLEKMPLTPNGKIDRKALPAPDDGLEMTYTAPRNATEAALAEIWGKVLKREKVGIHDNFFELGGHSLNGAELTFNIHKALNIEIPLKELFRTPTIAGLSEYIAGISESVYTQIKVVEPKEYYEVSSAVKRMWLLNQLEPESTGYNMPRVLQVDGNLQREKLAEVFRTLIARHDVLRTGFSMVGEEIVQKIAPNVNFELKYTEHKSENIDEVIKDFIKPFDLSQAPLLRVELVKVLEDSHILLLDMPHIISDGTSMAILTEEFVKLYNGEELPTQRISYKDFSVWQNQYLKSEKMKEQEQYWLEQFADEIPLLNLPLDYERPPMPSFKGDSVDFRLDRELTKQLRGLSKQTGTTLYMVLLSAINILLAKYTASEAIIVGSPIAGRTHGDLAGIIGMFVNTLAMRSYPQSEKTYREFLEEVKETALKAYENQDYQFEELVEKLNLERDISRHPLFDVMFVLQNIGEGNLEIEGLRLKRYNSPQMSAKFDLTFAAVEIDQEIAFSIEYSLSLFRRESIERMIAHLRNVLAAIAENTNVLLGNINILSPAERQQLLHEFNDTSQDYPRDKTVHQLFEEQVKRMPDHVALMFGTESMTYHELNARSNQLARVLRAKGIKADHLVGMMVERSFEMVIGILAILKAGGAYVPIDPEYPQDRIRFMIQDSGITILLTWSWLQEKAQFNGDILVLDERELYQGPDTNLEPVNQATDLAYVLYTSGSTGKPKGVMAGHRVLVNMLYDMERKCPLLPEDVYLLKTIYTFDVSTTEIFGWFIGGGKLAILPGGAEKNPEEIWQAMIQYGVTHINFVPSMLNTFIDILKMNQINHLGKLKYLVTAGEALTVHLVKKFFTTFTGSKLENVYGPTETVYTTIYPLERNVDYSTILIGKPMANYQIYILDANKMLCPLGVPGELYVSGDGLARGYLNLPELTASKFIPNPFIPGEQMYQTGDLARWLADGNIQYLGRLDQQVKLRGIRIELGEIESRLLELGSVKEAVVIAREDEDGDQSLCAYIVAEAEIAASEIREHLSVSLPDYMIPSYFVPLAKMPFTANGKVDRRALPEPEGKAEAEYVAPRNPLEETLAQIWSDVLGTRQIGIYDNFFELGGHSLKATVVTSRVHKELNVGLPLKELFRAPTISGISKYLINATKDPYSNIEPAPVKEYYEVSSAQKRIWLLQNFNLKSTGYNISNVLIVEGDINKQSMETALEALIARHEVLRASFATIGGEIVQRVAANVQLAINYAESPEADLEVVIKDFIQPFDLSKAPLLRVGLIKVGATRHYLLFDTHHIISDGISMSLLAKEFMAFYNGEELPKLRLGYKDFSEWQNAFLKSEAIKRQEQYWLDQFAGELPVLNLPLDYSRPAVQSFAGDRVRFALDHQVVEQLTALSRATGATLYMILLSAITILLSKYSGQEDMIVGSPIAGRRHADLDQILGMFVNTLAIRCYPKSEKQYRQYLKEVKDVALRAYENQDYQIEELFDKLNLIRDISRNPLFDVMFVHQNMELVELKLEGLRVSEYISEQTTAKFDLTFTAVESGDELIFSIDYCTSLFEHQTIQRLSVHLQTLIQAIASDQERSLKELDMMSKEERHQILYDFNDTYVAYPKDKMIHQRFEEQVTKNPDQIALRHEGQSMSYGELNRQANKLATGLRKKGVGRDQVVGILAKHSFEAIIGILGVLKAGGAYLPIDPDYPKDRIQFMLEDSGALILLAQSWLSEKTAVFLGECIWLDQEEWDEDVDENLQCVNLPSDLAYVIYTSGSTGKPKGVATTHQGMHNHILSKVEELPMTVASVVAQNGPLVFVISVWQCLAPLITGGVVAIYGKEVGEDP